MKLTNNSADEVKLSPNHVDLAQWYCLSSDHYDPVVSSHCNTPSRAGGCTKWRLIRAIGATATEYGYHHGRTIFSWWNSVTIQRTGCSSFKWVGRWPNCCSIDVVSAMSEQYRHHHRRPVFPPWNLQTTRRVDARILIYLMRLTRYLTDVDITNVAISSLEFTEWSDARVRV